jgi:glyoxylase-like metal-dependent hydrolase (beta-lactamase superfamily II)
MRLPHWRKTLAYGLLALVIVFGALFYVLFLQRERLPEAPERQRAAPALESLPRFKACWVESASILAGTPVGATASSLLVRHPGGDVLVDTGGSTRFDEETADYPWRTRFWLRLMVGGLKPRAPLPRLLEPLGVNPARLLVILSHSHLDHAGGLVDLPPVPVLVPQEERSYLADRDNWARGFVMPAHAVLLLDGRIVPIEFAAEKYETFGESFDLFHDGSVVIVPLHGHTPGSVGVFVNVSAQTRLLHIGDATDDVKGYEDNVGKTRPLRSTDADPARANAIVAQIHQLHRMVPSLHILPAHGRPAWVKAFPQGPGSCIGTPARK